MKTLKLFASSLFALGLAACDGEKSALTSSNAAKAPGTLNHDDMGHGKLSMSNQKNAIGKATGVIRSVGSQGDFLTIAHGPFDGGIKMDAMTMGFSIMGSVDLSSFAEGERVAFMVKQGRDGSYRIMAICNTSTSGADCLNGLIRGLNKRRGES